MGCSNSFLTDEINSLNSSSGYIINKYSKTSDYKLNYIVKEKLGEGSFGKVYKCEGRTKNKLPFAIKSLSKINVKHEVIQSYLREIEIFSFLDHPNIARYYETYETKKSIYIVMEYLQGDSLYKIIKDRERIKKIDERSICKMTYCLLKAVYFMHCNGIIHRDIKPEHILFSVNDDFGSIKIIDFGLSIQKSEWGGNNKVGTPYYMAPELIKGKRVYESDIWSIGVILYTICTGVKPFDGKNKILTFKKIVGGTYNETLLDKSNYSPEFKDLVKKMLTYDCKKRITSTEALKHEWFSSFGFGKKRDHFDIPVNLISNMKRFSSKNIFQKEVKYFITGLTTNEEIYSLKKLFNKIDLSSKGSISFEEFSEFIVKVDSSLTKPEIKDLFSRLDFHNDHDKITYSEFLSATLDMEENILEQRLEFIFLLNDEKNTGYMNIDIFINSIKEKRVNVKEKDLKSFFKANLGKDVTLINFENFKSLYQNKSVLV